MRSAGILFQEPENTIHSTDSSPPSEAVPSNSLQNIQPETRKKLEKEAVNESVKEEIKSKKLHTDRLKNLVSRGKVYLYSTRAIFPFDFFPDEISIEPDQVNICVKTFFFTAESRSIPIKNIADIYLSTSLLFASIKIIDNSYMENSVEVEYLRKGEAEKVRRIIQGLIIASKEDVDLSKIEPKRLVTEAERIGEMQGVQWRVDGK